jgi:CheY-like chemotaxis protein|tara:strand:- start:1585 stop:1857 length:273 start_codon:yes stop_codon:yes gene_type:complete
LNLRGSSIQDLILIDVNILDAVGLPAFKLFCQKPEIQKVPIISFTSESMAPINKRALGMKFYSCILKPIKISTKSEANQNCFGGVKILTK